MLKLKVASPDVAKQHLETLGKRFDEAMSSWKSPFAGYPPFTSDLKRVLQSERDFILVGDVSRLHKVVQQVKHKAGPLDHYLRNRPSAKSGVRQADMEKLITKLGEIFDYSKFIYKGVGWNAYKLVGSYSLRICPYCHLHHVNYHSQKAGYPKKLELRPPLDHFLPKSIYPYLAVSLYNLVPSCHQCNSSIKGDEDPSETMPHPFDTSVALDMSFTLKGSPLGIAGVTHEELGLTVTGNSTWDEFATFFHLQERYQWYAPEVTDMLKRKQFRDESDTVVQSLMRADFILGFDPLDYEKRALGICLRDIARRQGVL